MKVCRSIAVAAVLLLCAGTPGVTRALAQDRGAQNQAAAADHKFSDQDRKAAQDYHDQHRDHPPMGFRAADKLSAADQGRIRQGAVLTTDLRKRSHAVPADLLHRLPPPAKGHRYVVVGGQICDVDSGWHIFDVISINL